MRRCLKDTRCVTVPDLVLSCVIANNPAPPPPPPSAPVVVDGIDRWIEQFRLVGTLWQSFNKDDKTFLGRKGVTDNLLYRKYHHVACAVYLGVLYIYSLCKGRQSSLRRKKVVCIKKYTESSLCPPPLPVHAGVLVRFDRRMVVLYQLSSQFVRLRSSTRTPLPNLWPAGSEYHTGCLVC